MTIIATANEPARATDRITLHFGLVTIPLSVYTGTEATKVSRKEFFGDTEIPVGRANIRKDTGEVIDTAEVLRKAQATDGRFVILTDEEIADATAPKGQATIETFIPNKFIDQYLTENVAQVRPKAEKGKVDPNVAKAFALFLDTLRSQRVSALVKLALRGPARYAILTADGSLRYIYTADAIRQPRAIDRDFKFDSNEKALAATLVANIGISVAPPVLTDDTAVAVQAFVDRKAAGLPEAPAVEAPEPAGNLLAALEASIASTLKARKVAS